MSRPKLGLVAMGVALSLGVLAAAWPAASGVPEAEWPALRGLSVGTLAALLALSILARQGWRGLSRNVATGREERTAGGGLMQAAPALLTGLVFVLLASVPSWWAGISGDELEATTRYGQLSIGWTSHLSWPLVVGGALVASFSLARIARSLVDSSHRERFVVLAVCASSAWFAIEALLALKVIPAPIGLERASKLTALALLVGMATTAMVARASHAVLRGSIAVLLVVGTSVAGYGYWYRSPTPDALRSPRASWGEAVLGPLEGRPDLHGLFAVEPGSGDLSLVAVAPELLIETSRIGLQPVEGGIVYRKRGGLQSGHEGAVPRRESQLESESMLELRFRSWRFSLGSRATGFSVLQGWRSRVSPDRARCVVWGREPDRWRRSSGDALGLRASYRIELQEARGEDRSVLARDASSSPIAASIRQTAIDFLFLTDDPSRLAFRLEEGSRAWRQAAVRAEAPLLSTALPSLKLQSSVIRSLPLFAATFDLQSRSWSPLTELLPRVRSNRGLRRFDERLFGARCDRSWCLVSLDRPDEPVRLAELEVDRTLYDEILPLASGAVARLWSIGPIQDPDWQLTFHEADGSLRSTLELSGAVEAGLVGERADGALLVAWHSGPRGDGVSPIGGWRIEAIDPRTLVRRPIASTLEWFRAGEPAPSRLFRAVDGSWFVVDLGRPDPERRMDRWNPTIVSTAATEESVEPSR